MSSVSKIQRTTTLTRKYCSPVLLLYISQSLRILRVKCSLIERLRDTFPKIFPKILSYKIDLWIDNFKQTIKTWTWESKTYEKGEKVLLFAKPAKLIFGAKIQTNFSHIKEFHFKNGKIQLFIFKFRHETNFQKYTNVLKKWDIFVLTASSKASRSKIKSIELQGSSSCLAWGQFLHKTCHVIGHFRNLLGCLKTWISCLTHLLKSNLLYYSGALSRIGKL